MFEKIKEKSNEKKQTFHHNYHAGNMRGILSDRMCHLGTGPQR
jgi:hypothetical protein